MISRIEYKNVLSGYKLNNTDDDDTAIVDDNNTVDYNGCIFEEI